MANRLMEPSFMPISQSFDLAATLESGQVFRWEHNKGWYWGVAGPYGYGLRQIDDGLLFHTSAPSFEMAVQVIHSYFRLEDNLSDIRDYMANDEFLIEAET